MSDWYYAKNGKQNGPVSRETLADLVRNGMLDPTKDLVWTSTMKDWLPANQVPDLSDPQSSQSQPPADPSNPYSTPGSTWTEPAHSQPGETLEEIPHGSDPIDVTGCVKRGFELTTRNFGMILLVGIVYVAVTVVGQVIMTGVDSILGWGQNTQQTFTSDSGVYANYQQNGSFLNFFVNQILSVFLSLGITRIGLNLVSGREFSIGMLFGGGRKLLPAILATILYVLMVIVGLLLFIAPGVYLALRYGQYLNAMVDRDLGVMESLQYSSSITTNNRMNLFLLALLFIAITVAGVVALCVGLIFAIPVTWLSGLVAYRWLQYGRRAALDHPGTQTPMLAGGSR
jgi:hypothetical protein